MTRIVVPRGSGGSSSSANRSTSQLADSRSSQLAAAAAAAAGKEDEHDRSGGHREAGALEGLQHHQGDGGEERPHKREEVGIAGNSHGGVWIEGRPDSGTDNESHCGRGEESGPMTKEFNGLQVQGDTGDSVDGSSGSIAVSLCSPPPPVPPPKGSGSFVGTKRTGLGGSGATKNGSSRRQMGWHSLPVRSQQSDSRPSSPKSFVDSEGYNSADEQGPYFGPTYSDPDNERMFEAEIKRVKGFEVKKMVPDGNCLFRAVADQVYGDAEAYDTARQMCIDYMERERDHFSQFITENFTAYCKRKRHDKIYGNNVEIQAFSEMYNRPIHIYCYSTEPINIFHGGYGTDMPPIRLSYHHGNHYNSLIDPRRLTIGAGLGLSSLQGANIDKDKIKAAIKAQQDQQIDNALLTEGRFNSDLELTEKEIERMVMEASRAEYLAENRFKQQIGSEISSTSASAEPSSSGGKSSKARAAKKIEETSVVLSDSMNMVLAMGFSYLQAIEAYSIFGDDIDSMVCYLVETGASDLPGTSRQKGKAAE